MGRKSEFSWETADRICEMVSRGMSVAACAQEPGIPSRKTIYNWLDAQPEFLRKYTRAREARADWHADEIIDIADTEEDPNRARVRIEARKWVAAKLHSRVYGDSATVKGDPDAPLKVEHEHAVTPGLEKVLGILAGIAERERTR